MYRRMLWVSAAVTLIAACSTGGPGTVEVLRDRHETAGRIHVYDSLDDLLGNTRYRFGAAEPRPLTVAVVAGRFESAAPGRAFTVPGGDAPGGQVADFDDGDAVWKTVEGVFMVDHVVSGDASEGDRLTVGFAFGPDIDVGRVERDLRGLGRTLLFLNRSAVFAYDPSVHGTADDGTLVATVATDGTLALPALEAGEARQLLRSTPTLASLDAAAVRPTRTIVTDASGAALMEETETPRRTVPNVTRSACDAGPSVRSGVV